MVEELVEEGIVIRSSGGYAEVALTDVSRCENCSSKLFCGVNHNGDESILRVEDSIGLKPGDEVQISVAGKTILIFGMLFYGIPLLILLAGIFAGMIFFPPGNKEGLSFLSGIILIGIYYLVIYITGFSSRGFGPPAHIKAIKN